MQQHPDWLRRVRALRFGDYLAIFFVAALAVMFGILIATESKKYQNPNWGFGPEWDCTPSQTGGDPICFKRNSNSN